MAKDKSKKSEAPAEEVEVKKGKKSKGGDEFAKPSEAPKTGGGDGWKFETDDNLGDLFLITPLSEDSIEDSFHPGERKKIIVATIVKINEKKPEKSEVHEDAWVFGGWTQGSLRGFIGERRVLARLGQGEKDRGNKPWILEDADEDDIELATTYLASVDPFKTGSADKKKSKK